MMEDVDHSSIELPSHFWASHAPGRHMLVCYSLLIRLCVYCVEGDILITLQVSMETETDWTPILRVPSVVLRRGKQVTRGRVSASRGRM